MVPFPEQSFTKTNYNISFFHNKHFAWKNSTIIYFNTARSKYPSFVDKHTEQYRSMKPFTSKSLRPPLWGNLVFHTVECHTLHWQCNEWGVKWKGSCNKEGSSMLRPHKTVIRLDVSVKYTTGRSCHCILTMKKKTEQHLF